MAFVQRWSVYALKAVCLFNMVDETICSIQLSTGQSMLPTLRVSDDVLLSVPLSTYRLIAKHLPFNVAPMFHQEGKTFRTQQRAIDVGGPRGKLDPAMGTGISVGDLVVIPSYNYIFDDACKRVIGLAGDTVLVDPTIVPREDHSALWKDAQQRVTRKQEGLNNDDAQYIVVPPGHVWVAGDNALASVDSRTFGPLPLGVVKARVVARLLPWEWLPNTLKQASATESPPP